MGNNMWGVVITPVVAQVEPVQVVEEVAVEKPVKVKKPVKQDDTVPTVE